MHAEQIVTLSLSDDEHIITPNGIVRTESFLEGRLTTKLVVRVISGGSNKIVCEYLKINVRHKTMNLLGHCLFALSFWYGPIIISAPDR